VGDPDVGCDVLFFENFESFFHLWELGGVITVEPEEPGFDIDALFNHGLDFSLYVVVSGVGFFFFAKGIGAGEVAVMFEAELL